MNQTLRGHHVAVTMTGSPLLLSATLLGLTSGFGLRTISFQHKASNVAVAYVGFHETLSANAYAARLPAPVASEPAAPYIIGEFADGTLYTDNIWLLGSNGEVVMVAIIAV